MPKWKLQAWHKSFKVARNLKETLLQYNIYYSYLSIREKIKSPNFSVFCVDIFSYSKRKFPKPGKILHKSIRVMCHTQDQLKEEAIHTSVHLTSGDIWKRLRSHEDLLCPPSYMYCCISRTLKQQVTINLIKNFIRSTMTQERLNDFAVLSIESQLTKKIDFPGVLDTFAQKRPVKRHFNLISC